MADSIARFFSSGFPTSRGLLPSNSTDTASITALVAASQSGHPGNRTKIEEPPVELLTKIFGYTSGVYGGYDMAAGMRSTTS
ncbi:hypothetical protein FRB95_012088 [Tulasnella sp. JGI-2019a]|nr:hypothetical protein FRB95_012088 [Tulasnella sp. JGI-2019a]